MPGFSARRGLLRTIVAAATRTPSSWCGLIDPTERKGCELSKRNKPNQRRNRLDPHFSSENGSGLVPRRPACFREI